MFDMPVIARLRGQEHCASITGMIRHYAEPEGRLIFDHRLNAAMRYVVDLGAGQLADVLPISEVSVAASWPVGDGQLNPDGRRHRYQRCWPAGSRQDVGGLGESGGCGRFDG
jgi:hypothetical protein